MFDPIQPRLLCVFPNFHKNLKLLIEYPGYRGARLERLPIYEGGNECPNRSRSILFSTQTRIELSLPIETKESSAGKYEIELTSAVCASIFAKLKKRITFNSPGTIVHSVDIFPFWAKMKSVITALCDDFCRNFLSQSQVHVL